MRRLVDPLAVVVFMLMLVAFVAAQLIIWLAVMGGGQ
jgi:hypothetical protein